MTSSIVEDFTCAWKTYKASMKNISSKLRELSQQMQESGDTNIEELTYPQFMINASLSGIDIKATELLYLDLHTYAISINEFPLRMKKLDEIAQMSTSDDIDFMFIMTLIDISRIPSQFRKVSKVVNAIDNANPILVVKLLKDNIDKIVDLCIWSQGHSFLSWLDKRTAVKAQYSKSIMQFYDVLSKKLNDCRNTMALLR